MIGNEADEITAIAAIIARQFASLSRKPGTPGNWEAFAADFFPDSALYPAARPARRQGVEAFIERMKRLQGETLSSFHERVLGTEIRIFGNVTVALAACEITENDRRRTPGVEMLLLVKDEGRWHIVAQAWDNEMPGRPIPEHLLTAHRYSVFERSGHRFA